MTTPLRVLILEDRQSDAELMAHELLQAGFDPAWERVEAKADYLAHLDPAPDVILADYNLPQFSAPDALRLLREREMDVPFLVVTGSISEEVAVECIKQGAADYLLKDRLTRLGPAVAQALEQKVLRDAARRAEARIRHLNDLLRAIREVNQLLIRERNPDRLLAGACASLVKTRGYRLVWFGRPEEDGNRIGVVAGAGEGAGYLDGLRITWDEGPTGQGPTGLALRTRRPAACQDIAGEPRMAPWRDAAAAHGLVSMASLPLVSGERLYGTVTVYADRAQAFDGEEIGLLAEVSDDLALAMRSIEDERRRKRAEEETRNAARFPAENPDPILRLSRDGTVLYANEASGALLRDWECAVGGAAPASWRELVRDALASGDRRSIDIECDGLVYSICVVPFQDSGNVNLYAREVTERKRAEEALSKRTLQLEATRAITTEITQELDLTKLLRLITRRAAELVGAASGVVFLWDETSQALTTRAWHGLGDWVGDLHVRLGQGLAGAVAERREGVATEDYRASGAADPLAQDHTGIIAAIGEPLLYRDQLLGVLLVGHKLPKRVFIEEDRHLLSLFAAQAAIAIENAQLFARVSRAKAEWEDTFDSIQDLVVIIDRDQRVIRVNKALAKRLGAAPGALVGQPCYTVMHGMSSPRPGCPHAVVTVTEEAMSLEMDEPRLGGTFLISASPLHVEEGRSAGCVHVARDITELRRLEAESRDRLRLEDLSRAKSAFIATMSHELRTPLNSVIGFAEVLLEHGVGPLNEKQDRYLNHIRNSGKHLLALIGDILDLSKIESGKFSLQLESVSVPPMIDHVLAIARGLANKKSQFIAVDAPPELPPLRVDPVRLKQILFNLLSNAVKFTPNGGSITVTARRICDFRFPISDFSNQGSEPQSQIANRKSEINDWLEIAVADTGAGIRPEDLPRLFHEFVQLDTTQAQRAEGTGLGLALTKHLVELHGGRIRAESQGEGHGSTFTVALPFAGPGA